MLCHHDSTVQQAAINCLHVYNYEFLKPYRENLDRLLDNKHFRHELVVFSLDESSGKIHADHRSRLLPILMRILYGKFHSHETTHTSSKDTKSNKRSTIIQFLSSCNEYELNYFFNLIFDCINIHNFDLIADESAKNQSFDPFEINENSYDQEKRDELQHRLHAKLLDTKSVDLLVDLKKVIPLKKILGVLQSLEIILNKLARQMETFSHRLLQILCFIHKYASALYELGQESKCVEEYNFNLLKIIRQKVTLRFKQFFDTFDHLNFTQSEYFFVFDSFIWPQSIKLAAESQQSINNLLKIFSSWSEKSIYYPMFVIKLNNFDQVNSEYVQTLSSLYQVRKTNLLEYFKSRSVLDIVFELLDSPKCSSTVINFILDMIHNLISFADFKQEQNENSSEVMDTKPLPFSVDHIVEEFKNTNEKDLNFGTMMLKPYVTSIINHIEKIVIANMSKKLLPTRPLKILARLSCFATNSQAQCEKIIQLLIPYLIKNRKQTEESESNILNSINHLLTQVSNVAEFIW